MITGVLTENQTAHSEMQVRDMSQFAYQTAQSMVTPLMKEIRFGLQHLIK